MPLTEPTWMKPIKAQKNHVLLHDTSLENAIGILTSLQIFGSGGFDHCSTEAYPHFICEGWSRGGNWLPVNAEVSMVFGCNLPARWRGEGNDIPEPGWLEVYSIQGEPWQCSIHPDSPPLSFLGVRNCTLRQTWHDFFPVGRSLQGRLLRAAKHAKEKNLKIEASCLRPA